MVTTCFGFNCRQRVECRVTPTDRAWWSPLPQLRILGKIAIKHFPMQDTLTPWPSEWRNLCIFNCIVRQDLCWATPPRPSARTTTRRCVTSIEGARILSLDNDNDPSRNDASDNIWISFRLSIHNYFDSFQFNNHHDPTTNPWLCPPTISKKIVIVDFTGCVCSPIPPCLWKFLQNQKMSPSSKTTTSVH